MGEFKSERERERERERQRQRQRETDTERAVVVRSPHTPLPGSLTYVKILSFKTNTEFKYS